MAYSLNLLGKTFDELAALFFVEISDDDDFYDVIAEQLARRHSSQLITMLPCLSAKRVRAAIYGLGAAKIKDARPVLRSYLSSADSLVVAATLDAFRRIGPDRWVENSEWLSHPSPYVKSAALRLCKLQLGPAAIRQLRDSLNDESEIVRQSALDELEGIVTSDDIGWLAASLSDVSPDVREAAKALVDSIP